MLKLRVAVLVKRGEQGRAGTTACSGTAGATRGMPVQARAAADRTPATRPGTAYVVNAGSGSVTPIAIANNRAGPAIKVGDNPHAIAITPDGKTAYVANYVSGTVTPITTATGKPGPAITVGKGPFGIAIIPDSRTVYVTDFGSGTVTPISTATNKAGPAITVGKGPFGIAISP